MGGELLINDLVIREQSIVASSMAVAATDSNTVVVFEGRGPLDRQGVFARVLGTEGQTTTPSFRVNSTIRGDQFSPAVSANDDGNFVVAWAGRGPGDKQGVFFQRLDSTGTAVGGETLVNETTGGRQSEPALAIASDGSFVVAWSGVGEGDVSGIFLRRFDASGTPIGGEILVNTTTADQQVEPAIAFDSTGGFVVGWSSRHQDGSDWGLFGQRFDATAMPVGEEFQWNSTTENSQQSVTLAADPDGGIVAAWQSRAQDGDGWGVVARQLAADGTTLGSEVVLNNTTVGQQRDVSLAIAEDGQWLAAWTTGTTDGAGWEVEARSFTADATAEGDAFAVNRETAGANSGLQYRPSVAIAGDDAFIAWSGAGESDRRAIYLQVYEVDLVDDGPQQSPDLAAIADQTSDVNMQFEFTVTATDPNSRDTLTFTLDPDNRPETATIEQTDNQTAIIRWTPTPLEAGQTFSFRVLVTDDGNSPLSDSEDFSVTVGASDAANLVGFAEALANANAQFFGAVWNQTSTDQRELFDDGGQFLPFVDVTNADRSLNQAAADNNIEVADLPVWVFADGTRLEGVQSLQSIAAASGIAIPASNTPSLAPLPDDTLLVGSPLHVPLDGYDPNGGPLTYTVTTDNAGVTAEILTGNRSARINVAGYGDLVFELFEQRATRATDRFIELADDGFYEDIIFHRIINGFIIQGGDPNGTGTGGSTLGDFDDQFDVDLQHNRTGLLSFAKSTDDTNDSQFFITEGDGSSLRNLDFNHSIFGILSEGEAVREAISNTAVSGPASSPRPINDIVMEGVEIFQDNENATLLLRAADGVSGPVNVTVTVNDQNGNTFERTFEVTVSDDTINGRPFLGDIAPVSVAVNTAAQIQLTATDVEGDPVVFSAVRRGTVNYTFDVSDTGLLTVTPPTDFVGTLEIEARVRREVPTSATDFDAQLITITVGG